MKSYFWENVSIRLILFFLILCVPALQQFVCASVANKTLPIIRKLSLSHGAPDENDESQRLADHSNNPFASSWSRVDDTTANHSSGASAMLRNLAANGFGHSMFETNLVDRGYRLIAGASSPNKTDFLQPSSRHLQTLNTQFSFFSPSSSFLRHLAFADKLEETFGLGVAGSVTVFVVVIVLSSVLIFVAVPLAIISCFRTVVEISSDDDALAAELFSTAREIKELNAKEVSGKDTLLSDNESKHLSIEAVVGSFVLLPHDRSISRLAAADEKSIERLGPTKMLQILKMCDKLADSGVRLRRTEHATILAEFASQRRKTKAAKSAGKSAAFSSHYSQSIVSNKPIPLQESALVEIRIANMRPSSVVAIGVSPRWYPSYRLPGWHSGSFAYHSSDGCLYKEDSSSVGMEGGQRFGKGDTIGLLSKRRAQGSLELHFFRNGNLQTIALLPVEQMTRNVHVSLGACGSVTMEVNFGTAPYSFPPLTILNTDVLRFGASTSSLAPSKRHLTASGSPPVALPGENYSSVYASTVYDGMGVLQPPAAYLVPRTGFIPVGRLGVTTGEFTPVNVKAEKPEEVVKGDFGGADLSPEGVTHFKQVDESGPLTESTAPTSPLSPNTMSPIGLSEGDISPQFVEGGGGAGQHSTTTPPV